MCAEAPNFKDLQEKKQSYLDSYNSHVAQAKEYNELMARTLDTMPTIPSQEEIVHHVNMVLINDSTLESTTKREMTEGRSLVFCIRLSISSLEISSDPALLS